MRSINNRNRNLGIQQGRQAAKTIVRNGSDRPSPSFDALVGLASYAWESLRTALRPWAAPATCTTTHVTGGAASAKPLASSGRHAAMAMCRLAAR
jgi:hypothetical protein